MRETWPEDYDIPSWLDALTHDLPEGPPSSWRYAWAGVFFTCAIFGVISSIGAESENGSHSCGFVFIPAILGVFVSAFSWLYSSELTSKEIRDLWVRSIREKSRADSYTRAWTNEQVDEIEKVLKWSLNYFENCADEGHIVRKNSFLKRSFFKWYYGNVPRPRTYVSERNLYLDALLLEITIRRRNIRPEHG